MAWSFNGNGTITSAMDGRCLQVAAGGGVVMGACTGSSNQRFNITGAQRGSDGDGDGSITVRQGAGCVDNNASPAPVPPRPSPPGAGANITLALSALDLGFGGTARVRDVWGKRFLPDADTGGALDVTVTHHGSAFFVIMPKGSEWPLPFKLAPWMAEPVQPVGAS
eukprot:g6737.t1